jgi:hypothetical protein
MPQKIFSVQRGDIRPEISPLREVEVSDAFGAAIALTLTLSQRERG